MKEITTIDELLDAIPEGHEIAEVLLNNLSVLSLAIEGKVTIKGFENGKLVSENTKLGHKQMIDRLVKEMDAKRTTN